MDIRGTVVFGVSFILPLGLDLSEMDTNTATDALERDEHNTRCSQMDGHAPRNKRENKGTPERESE